MRVFILYLNKARTDGNFNLDDLPSSGGRIDVLCRCATAALWLSHALRKDTKIIGVLNGSPNPPITITIDSNILRGVSPDERSVASWIKKALSDVGMRTRSGIVAERKSFQDVVREYSNHPIYILHEKGENIKKCALEGDDFVFILGDHIGIPRNDERFAERYARAKISLGPQSYLASSCITIINWFLDNANPT